MLRKRKRSHYTRRNSYMMPTLFILAVSMAAAFGGAMYWDKLQNNDHKQDITYEDNRTAEGEEISLPDLEDPDSSSLSEENTETDPVKTEEEPVPEPIPVVVEECPEVDSSYFTDAAFIGDSLTQGLQLYDILDTNVVANKGINLQSVYQEDKIRVAEGYTSVMKELDRIQPAKIYILLGANDIGWREESAFKDLYAKLVDTIQAQHPDAVLYLQSMFPVTQGYSNKDNGITNEKLTRYNQEIIAVAEEKGAYYLDIASALKDETGALPDEVSPDGMHLNAPYYQIWFDYLKTHVVPEA